MGTMAILDRKKGDQKISWDPDKPAEVEQAQATFDHLRKQGYMAYTVDKKGGKGTMVNKFDKKLENLILAPALVGG